MFNPALRPTSVVAKTTILHASPLIFCEIAHASAHCCTLANEPREWSLLWHSLFSLTFNVHRRRNAVRIPTIVRENPSGQLLSDACSAQHSPFLLPLFA